MVTFTVGCGASAILQAPAVLVFSPRKSTIYIACKLTGADQEQLAKIKRIIDELNERFEVLPFAFDLNNAISLGNPKNVLRHDLGHVEEADFMVVIIDGDSSDGRGMEIVFRATRGSQEQIERTLILHMAGKPLSAMYLGFDEMFCTSTLEIDSLDEIPRLVAAHFSF